MGSGHPELNSGYISLCSWHLRLEFSGGGGETKSRWTARKFARHLVGEGRGDLGAGGSVFSVAVTIKHFSIATKNIKAAVRLGSNRFQ